MNSGFHILVIYMAAFPPMYKDNFLVHTKTMVNLLSDRESFVCIVYSALEIYNINKAGC